MAATNYVSSRDRLLGMPAVFSVAELALVMDCPRSEASQYLWRWRANKLVVPFGGRSGVFLNLVIAPRAASDGALWERSLLKAMPSAIIGGHEVLADSGVSTQVTHQRYILVSGSDSTFDVPGAEIHRRPASWLGRLVRMGAVINEAPGQMAPRLSPGGALADLAVYGGYTPDPDDIDLEAMGADNLRLYQRLTAAQPLATQLPRALQPMQGLQGSACEPPVETSTNDLTVSRLSTRP